MNKFIAILYDSYKEAVSTWVLQVMLGLSVILMLFVASISFRMVTLEYALGNSFGLYNWAGRSDPKTGNPQWVIERVVPSNPGEPWKSDYTFDVVVRCETPEKLKLAQESGLPMSKDAIRSELRKDLYYLDKIQVVEVVAPPGTKPSEVRFNVTTTGTKTPDRLSWPHEPTVFFAIKVPFMTQSLRDGLYWMQKKLVNDAGAWATLLVSIVITAGFIPNMLRKGTLDLYVSKPLSRPALLIYKYIGGLTFVAILNSVTIGGVWLVIGLRNGVWAPEFLAVIPVLTFYFAILYAVSTFVAVFTRSSLVAILATVVAWTIFFAYGYLHDQVAKITREEAKIKEQLAGFRKGGDDDDLPPDVNQFREVADWAKWVDMIGRPIVPRTYDLDDRGIQLIADGLLTDAEKKRRGLDQPLPSWGETLGLSSAFIAILLGLSCWRFSTRDG